MGLGQALRAFRDDTSLFVSFVRFVVNFFES